MERTAKRLAKLASLVLLAYLAATCALQWRGEQASKPVTDCQQQRAQQRDQCKRALFDGLARPEIARYKFSPPARSIPAELLSAFTQNGAMPVRRYAYVNEAQDESNPLYAQRQTVITVDEVEGWRAKVRKDQALGYNSFALARTMKKHRAQLADRPLLVLGNQQPWVEAIGLELGARPITTVDHARKRYQQMLTDLKWIQLNTFLDELFTKWSSNTSLPRFSNAVSFSYIEHLGLGRYGENLSPDADLHALRLLGCLLEPGGLLFLGLQTSPRLNESYIEFNFHRVYGEQRLALLLGSDDWQVLSSEREDHNKHSLFVLQKPPLPDQCAHF